MYGFDRKHRNVAPGNCDRSCPLTVLAHSADTFSVLSPLSAAGLPLRVALYGATTVLGSSSPCFALRTAHLSPSASASLTAALK